MQDTYLPRIARRWLRGKIPSTVDIEGDHYVVTLIIKTMRAKRMVNAILPGLIKRLKKAAVAGRGKLVAVYTTNGWPGFLERVYTYEAPAKG